MPMRSVEKGTARNQRGIELVVRILFNSLPSVLVEMVSFCFDKGREVTSLITIGNASDFQFLPFECKDKIIILIEYKEETIC